PATAAHGSGRKVATAVGRSWVVRAAPPAVPIRPPVGAARAALSGAPENGREARTRPRAADMNRRNRPLPHPRPARLAIAAAVALCTLAGAAQAVQYQWRDDKGRMVYSDLPPPASVTPDRIVRAPGPRPSDATPAPAAATDPASDSAPQAV